MRHMTRLLATALTAAALLVALQQASLAQGSGGDVRPTGKGGGILPQESIGGPQPGVGSAPNASNKLTYHGGPIMTGGVTLYYIWYGSWSGNSANTILQDFAANIGGSPYWAINTNYYNSSNAKVTSVVTYGGSTTDNYSQGTNLSDTGVFNVVNSAITSGRLPKNTSGIYFVLTSQDVNETSGFCTSYCGWHTYGTVSGSTIKYSFVGDAARCLSACAFQSTVSPNANPGADAMVSIIAHEAEEAATDPQLNAWYDRLGQENADKCAWTFGTTYTTGNGSLANMKLGARDYLVQQNWSMPPGKPQVCALRFP